MLDEHTKLTVPGGIFAHGFVHFQRWPNENKIIDRGENVTLVSQDVKLALLYIINIIIIFNTYTAKPIANNRRR